MAQETPSESVFVAYNRGYANGVDALGKALLDILDSVPHITVEEIRTAVEGLIPATRSGF